MDKSDVDSDSASRGLELESFRVAVALRTVKVSKNNTIMLCYLHEETKNRR